MLSLKYRFGKAHCEVWWRRIASAGDRTCAPLRSRTIKARRHRSPSFPGDKIYRYYQTFVSFATPDINQP